MSNDKRSELIEAVGRALCAVCKDQASAVIDIALKAAATEALRLADEWNREWRAGLKGSTYTEGKSDGADECANAILALTSEAADVTDADGRCAPNPIGDPE
jgi:hypothetical protein